MINKKIIFAISVMSVISMGMLSACGNAVSTEQKSENVAVTENENVAANENTGNVDEVAEPAADESTFSLKDYEGFYYYTGIDEIEGSTLVYTYGYLFNSDGTGVSYIQDVVDFTWNETEMRYGEFTESFSMEQDKLIVNDMEFRKIEGKLITPNPYKVDVNNIEDGFFHAYMDESGINEENGKFAIRTDILTVDTYDIADIDGMTEGDAIFIKNQLFYINSIDKTPFGIININGGIENFGSALIANDELNCYVYVGMDMEKSYTCQGVATLTVSDDVKFVDKRDMSEEKEYIGSDAISELKNVLKEDRLDWDNCTVTIENGEIVEIDRLFTP